MRAWAADHQASSQSRWHRVERGLKSRSMGQPRSIHRTSVSRSSSERPATWILLPSGTVISARHGRRWRHDAAREVEIGSIAIGRRIRDRNASLLEGAGVAGNCFGGEFVVGPAVGATAEDLPDQQAAARLKHAHITRRVGIPPRADQRRAGRSGRRSPSPAGSTCRARRRHWVDRPCLSSSRTRFRGRLFVFCVWQATQLRSRIGLMSRKYSTFLTPS